MSLEQAESIYLTGVYEAELKLFLFVADRCFDYSQAVEVARCCFWLSSNVKCSSHFSKLLRIVSKIFLPFLSNIRIVSDVI
jgi:hypothetical protein